MAQSFSSWAVLPDSGFDSQCPCGSSQAWVALIPENLIPFSACFGHQKHTETHSGKNTLTYKIEFLQKRCVFVVSESIIKRLFPSVPVWLLPLPSSLAWKQLLTPLLPLSGMCAFSVGLLLRVLAGSFLCLFFSISFFSTWCALAFSDDGHPVTKQLSQMTLC